MLKIKGMPSKKPSDVTPKPMKLIDRVLDRIDLDELSSSLADKLCKKLVESLNVDRLVSTLFDKHGEELQQGLMEAIVNRL